MPADLDALIAALHERLSAQAEHGSHAELWRTLDEIRALRQQIEAVEAEDDGFSRDRRDPAA